MVNRIKKRLKKRTYTANDRHIARQIIAAMDVRKTGYTKSNEYGSSQRFKKCLIPTAGAKNFRDFNPDKLREGHPEFLREYQVAFLARYGYQKILKLLFF